MDAAKVLPEHFPVLEIVRLWVTTIKPDTGTLESLKAMDHTDMAVDRFFVDEVPPTALCQAVIVLRGGTPFCSLEIFTIGVQD